MATQLLDSGIVILALRRNARALDLIPLDSDDPPCVSVVTRTEILAGMRPHEETRTLELLDALSTLAVGPSIADRAGRLIYEYARKGIQFSVADALIAATALDHQLVLVTTNKDHFPVPELKVEPFSAA